MASMADASNCDTVVQILARMPAGADYAPKLDNLGFELCTDFSGDAFSIAAEVLSIMLPGHCHWFSHIVVAARERSFLAGSKHLSTPPGTVTVRSIFRAAGVGGALYQRV